MPQLLAALAPLTFGATAGSLALVTTAGGLTLAGSLVSIGGSLLLSAAANALFGPEQPKDAGRELSLPSTAPAYRFVYGDCRATGTPVGTPVRGDYIWGCWLLNSRPSKLPSFTLFLDKREVALTGDAFNFAGSGANGTTFPFIGKDGTTNIVRVWISRGDQAGPPAQFLADAPWAAGANADLWKPTDGWQGRTVLWARFNAGSTASRQERWPSSPPLVEVEGRWSTVWDPRDAGQDPDDPATWLWRDNHALVVLDTLRQNPVRQYRSLNLHLDSFKEAADIADETVALASGGSEPRYRVAGTLTFEGGEIEDLVNPLVVSGAADLVRIGGRLGLAAGAWRAPTQTVTYELGEALEFSDLLPEDALVNELRVSYLSLARGSETAELQPWVIPGALSDDGGVARTKSLALDFCPSPTQAMRVRKILGRRLRRQQTLGLTLPPECFDLVAGATVTIDFPAPFGAAMDGVYEVQEINPHLDPMGEGGCALRLPARLVLHPSSVYAWNPATDEETIVDEPYDGERQGVQMPGMLTATVSDHTSGGSTVQRITFKFDPSPSGGVEHYQWQYRAGSGPWTSGGRIDDEVDDGTGKVFGVLDMVSSAPHDIRARTVAAAGKSDWRELHDVQPLAMTGGAGTAGLGSATFTGTAPASVSATKIRVLRAATNDFGSATQVGSDHTVTPGAAFSITAGDATIVNLLENPGFDTDTLWAKGAGWTISGGKASHAAGSAGNLDQAENGPGSGASVRVGVTIGNRTGGSATLRLVGGSTVSGSAISVNGRHVETMTAPSALATFRVVGTSTFAGSVDDLAAFVGTAGCLPQGLGYYWLVPVTTTGALGAESGPYALTIT